MSLKKKITIYTVQNEEGVKVSFTTKAQAEQAVELLTSFAVTVELVKEKREVTL